MFRRNNKPNTAARSSRRLRSESQYIISEHGRQYKRLRSIWLLSIGLIILLLFILFYLNYSVYRRVVTGLNQVQELRASKEGLGVDVIDFTQYEAATAYWDAKGVSSTATVERHPFLFGSIAQTQTDVVSSTDSESAQ